MQNRVHEWDWGLFWVTLLFVVFGLLTVYSASAIVAEHWYHQSQYLFFIKQLIWAGLGLVLMMTVSKVDYHWWGEKARILGVGVVALLVGVLIVSEPIAGARRWLRLGPLSFQPAEVAKICLIIYLADFLTRHKDRVPSFVQGILMPFLVVLLYAGLILLEPDFGTVVILCLIFLVMFFVAGAKIAHLGVLLLGILPLLWLTIFSSPYRKQRVLAFLDYSFQEGEKGYQISQSLLSLGSGGWWGVGLGKGEGKLLYLPQVHTDFIFSHIGEELGFIATGAIVLGFIFFLWRGMKIAVHCGDLLGRMLAVGFSFLIAGEAMVNIGVVTGLLPTKGLGLPFFSFGGSSLVLCLVAVGILLNISRQTR